MIRYRRSRHHRPAAPGRGQSGNPRTVPQGLGNPNQRGVGGSGGSHQAPTRGNPPTTPDQPGRCANAAASIPAMDGIDATAPCPKTIARLAAADSTSCTPKTLSHAPAVLAAGPHIPIPDQPPHSLPTASRQPSAISRNATGILRLSDSHARSPPPPSSRILPVPAALHFLHPTSLKPTTRGRGPPPANHGPPQANLHLLPTSLPPTASSCATACLRYTRQHSAHRSQRAHGTRPRSAHQNKYTKTEHPR
jgi:hypothetical protein